MDKGTLSLCMIVKNEANFIGRCLDCVKPAVDEMIVVDTGSTDNTPEICQERGARVFPYTWDNDFSAARNYSLRHARGEWILWLDADEQMEVADVPHLRKFVQQEQKDHLFSIKLINFHGDPPPHPDRSFIIAHHRIFRNRVGFRFSNPIHEQLNVHEVLPHVKQISMLPIRVYHYGYMESVANNRKKFERNLRMLEEALEQGDTNPWIPYHIASEYYRSNEYRRSFEYVNRSILRFIQENQTPPSLLYKLKYAILLLLGSVNGAYPGIERAITLYPNYVDLHFYKGVIFFTKERYEEAVKVFQHCLLLGEDNLEHLVLRGLGTFQAWYYIGQCEEKLGRTPAALYAYAQALILSPSYEPAWSALQTWVKSNHTLFPAFKKRKWIPSANRLLLLEKIEEYAEQRAQPS